MNEIKIDKRIAVFLLKYDIIKDAVIVCKEYGDDEDFVEITPDEWELMEKDNEYQTFEIWLNSDKKPIESSY